MKIGFVSSSGGHWEELLCLKELAAEHDSFYVTEKGEQSDHCGIRALYTVPQINRQERGFLFHFLRLFFTAWRILKMEKPDVEYIEGLSPAISIDQKTTSRNPRSTVGTVTEIHDYLRLLYARIGKPHCPVCGKLITSQSVDQMVDTIMEFPEGTKLMVLAPVIRGRKGEHEKILERIAKEGFTRVRVDGEIKLINEEEIKLEKTFKHNIEIVVDRIVVKPGQEGRISEACELAMAHGEGLVNVIGDYYDHHYAKTFSSKLACPEHGIYAKVKSGQSD